MALKSVKLVISDLHIGQGRRLPNGAFNFFEDFNEDGRFASFLAYYTQQYSSAPIELILNGDFFDCIRRPRMGRFPDVMFESLAVQIMTASLKAHPTVVRALQDFLAEPKNTVVMLIGESDCGLLWDKVQAILKKEISSRIEIKAGGYQTNGMYFEHGHQSAVISRFPNQLFEMDPSEKIRVLNLPWAAHFVSDYVVPLRRIAPHLGMVRPLYIYFVWMLLFDFVFAFRMGLRLIKVFFSNRLRRGRSAYGIIRSIHVILEFFLRRERRHFNDGYVRELLTQTKAKIVFLGHSHLPNYRIFEEGHAYCNTGSWTKTVSLDMNYIGARVVLPFALVEIEDGDRLNVELLEWKGAHEPVIDFA